METLSQVGMRFNVIRARVSQMLNLLNLDESIREYLSSIDDAQKHNYFTERKLRNIAVIKDKKERNSSFRKLVGKIRGHDELSPMERMTDDLYLGEQV